MLSWSRCALCASAALFTSACIVAPPPTYGDPEPTRPNINQPLVVPAPGQLLFAQLTERIPFTVPFASVDAGEAVRWVLWKDYGLNGMTNLRKGSLAAAPSPAEGQPVPDRDITFDWLVDSNVGTGCVQLTLVVTHDSNIDFDTDLPIDKTLVGQVTWWANVGATFEEQQTLVNCPSASSVSGAP
jgi:hypothetical protein